MNGLYGFCTFIVDEFAINVHTNVDTKKIINQFIE